MKQSGNNVSRQIFELFPANNVQAYVSGKYCEIIVKFRVHHLSIMKIIDLLVPIN